LAQTGSFTQTARQLHLSQSAISHSIKALEADVQCRLLDRVGKNATLTQAGEQLLVHAERILAEMQEARRRLRELGQWGHGRLRIGASTTACQYLLPKVLSEFKESFPHCRIQIEPGDTPAALELLQGQRIDLGLCLEPRQADRLEFRPLFKDDLRFLLGPLHPWARAGRVDRSEITRQRFILYTRTSYLADMVEDYFQKDGMVLPTSIELGNIEAIKELVKLEVGISILAPWVARRELEEGSLRALPLGTRKLERTWGILLRQGQQLSLAHQTFIRLCSTIADHLETGPSA
jgi:DNA-binding transcriptional LysR family regulator